MDTCTAETGLLKKKPCGQNAVTKCANCEQPLCAKHASALMSAGKKTTLCPECAKAWREQAKTIGELPSTPAAAPKKPVEVPKAAAPAAKPAAAPAPQAAAAPKPAAAPAAPASEKKELSLEDSQPLQFTPSKKPEEKK